MNLLRNLFLRKINFCFYVLWSTQCWTADIKLVLISTVILKIMQLLSPKRLGKSQHSCCIDTVCVLCSRECFHFQTFITSVKISRNPDWIWIARFYLALRMTSNIENNAIYFNFKLKNNDKQFSMNDLGLQMISYKYNNQKKHERKITTSLLSLTNYYTLAFAFEGQRNCKCIKKQSKALT